MIIRSRSNQAMWTATYSYGPGVGTRAQVGLTGRLWTQIVRGTKRADWAVLKPSGRRDVPDAY
jgi:hypothetical protein